MKELLDAGWRAAAYCLHPRVIWLSLLPLLVAGALAALLGWLYWESAVACVREKLAAWSLIGSGLDWLASLGLDSLRALLAPLVVVALAVPLVVVTSLLVVALLMMPSLVEMVAARRFATLERKHGEPFWRAALASLAATLAVLFALLITIPLWLIPPLVLLVPPLIWGWLSYRVMSFDALAEHASRAERRQIMREQRLPLLGIGIVTGYLGAAPALLWAVGGVFALALAPVLIVAAVWLYTLVFAFSALWFTHYALAALAALRAAAPPAAAVDPGAAEPALLPPV